LDSTEKHQIVATIQTRVANLPVFHRL